VVDLCCGSGASALAAARETGPQGRVVGFDVAEGLLTLAREKAAGEGLENVEFVLRDATATGLVSECANVVVCVFGVFFAPDMAEFVGEMWRLLTPGGRLVVTTWGPGLFEPGNSMFWDSVREVDPSLYKAFNPWDSLTSTQQVLDLFSSAGAGVPVIDAVAGRHPLDRPSDFWQVVMGSGYRNTIDALEPAKRSSLQSTVIQRLEAEEVHEITVDVLYAVSHKTP
jgi:SAM-dependent methyltransferase